MFYSYNRTFNLHFCDFKVRDSSLWETNGKNRAALRVIFGGNRPPCRVIIILQRANPILYPVSTCVFSHDRTCQTGRVNSSFQSPAAVVDGNLGIQWVVLSNNLNLPVIACGFHAILRMF